RWGPRVRPLRKPNCGGDGQPVEPRIGWFGVHRRLAADRAPARNARARGSVRELGPARTQLGRAAAACSNLRRRFSRQALRRYPLRMESERARLLLARERERIEQAIAGLGAEDASGGGEEQEPGDEDSEDLYQDEFDAGLAEDLAEQLA